MLIVDWKRGWGTWFREASSATVRDVRRLLAWVAWRFWLQSDKGGRGQKNREEIGGGAIFIFLAASPLVRPARQNCHATQARRLPSHRQKSVRKQNHLHFLFAWYGERKVRCRADLCLALWERVLNRPFYGIRDFLHYLKLVMRDLKEKSRRDSVLKVCAGGGTPKTTLGITGLHEI